MSQLAMSKYFVWGYMRWVVLNGYPNMQMHTFLTLVWEGEGGGGGWGGSISVA